jgi:hypothetical protein
MLPTNEALTSPKMIVAVLIFLGLAKLISMFSQSIFFKNTLCKLGIHKSDGDYGLRWYDKAYVSDCERCKQTLTQSTITQRVIEWLGI